VSIDVDHASLLNIRWVKNHVSGYRVVSDGYTVQLQQARNNLNIGDVRNIFQDGWSLAQKGSHHRLGN
jgi:hypothetical protein